MPQLWLTYEEMGQEYGCDREAAREEAVLRGWPRKRSRDGLTRVLLPTQLMTAFAVGLAARAAALDAQTDEMVMQLVSQLAASKKPVATELVSIEASRRSA